MSVEPRSLKFKEANRIGKIGRGLAAALLLTVGAEGAAAPKSESDKYRQLSHLTSERLDLVVEHADTILKSGNDKKIAELLGTPTGAATFNETFYAIVPEEMVTDTIFAMLISGKYNSVLKNYFSVPTNWQFFFEKCEQLKPDYLPLLLSGQNPNVFLDAARQNTNEPWFKKLIKQLAKYFKEERWWQELAREAK